MKPSDSIIILVKYIICHVGLENFLKEEKKISHELQDIITIIRVHENYERISVKFISLVFYLNFTKNIISSDYSNHHGDFGVKKRSRVQSSTSISRKFDTIDPRKVYHL